MSKASVSLNKLPADINQQFKVLGSEMKLATSEFDTNERSAESLTAKDEFLTKQIDAQKDKIETLSRTPPTASVRTTAVRRLSFLVEGSDLYEQHRKPTPRGSGAARTKCRRKCLASSELFH